MDEVTVIIPGTSNQGDNHDIILSRQPTVTLSENGKKHHQNLQHISDGHPAYAPLALGKGHLALAASGKAIWT